MTSQKQIAANRRNAARSTGPVTPEGKARASRNALRHGLSRPISRAGAAATGIGKFVHELVGDDASATEVDLATSAVEAQWDLARIRHARRRILAHDLLGEPSTDGQREEAPSDLQAIKRLARLERYERRAQSRRKTALGRLSHLCRLPIFG